MAQTSNKDDFDNFSKGLTPVDISVNHKNFSEKMREIEKLTRNKRSEPVLPSKAMGEDYSYSLKQLDIKVKTS